MAVEQQTDFGASWSSLTNTNSGYGPRLTITNRTVEKLSFYLRRTGTPGGTLTFLIRAVSGDAVLLTKLWGNSNDISDTAAWYEVTFDSSLFINEEVNILAVVTVGSAGNVINIYQTASDVKADEYAVRRSNVGAYTTYTTKDAPYIYTYTEGGQDAPVVTTQACTNVIARTATGNGNLQSLGTSAVTQHGHVWHTSDPPTTSNSKTLNGAAPNQGPFSSSITGLTPGTLYYVRAYATNSTGTSYGVSVQIAGNVTTIGGRYWWVEGNAFHFVDQWGVERKAEGVVDGTGLPWYYYM